MRRPAELTLEAPSPARIAGSNGARSFDMVAYTGGVFDVGFGPCACDLAGLELAESIPALRQHDWARYVGRGSARVEGDQLHVAGALFSGVEDAEEVCRISDQGGQWQASIRAAIDWQAVDEIGRSSSVELNGRTLQGPLLVLRKTKLRETSFVVLGADDQTSAVVLADAPPKEAPVTDPVTDPVKAERQRVSEIRAQFAKDTEFALEAIDKGWSLLEAKAAYSDRLQDVHAKAMKAQADKIAELEAKAGAKAKPSPAAALGGAAPPPTSGGDPEEAFLAAVDAEVQRMKSIDARPTLRRGLASSPEADLRASATATIARRDPAAHKAFLDHHNARVTAARKRAIGR